MAEGYKITPENLVYHTLIGLEALVSGSTNPDMVGIAGAVIDETRNTLVISPSLTGIFHGKSNRDIGSDGDRGNRGVLPESPSQMSPECDGAAPIVLSGNGDRIVPKSHTTFIFGLPGSDRVRVMVNGGLLVARPEDRIAKKHKKPGRI
ncbi:MAG: ribonuclease P protein component 1 [Euryarchaeota archaeon]|nr:ribonuclease P protein component 1 [Euryarchaeota archaeon]